MSEQSKSVFISYRRSTTKFLSLLLFRELTSRSYDVFRDIERIGSGDFENVILSQIAARAHFVVLLTHGTLDRCIENGDWLRREIEEAIRLKRNIIPILVDGFRFEDGEQYLTGELQNLKKFNSLNLYSESEYFDVGLNKLCTKYLVLPNYGKIEPTPTEIESTVQEILEETQEEPIPTADEITAERFFVEALRMQKNQNYTKAIELYNQAIGLNPTYAKLYYNRGLAHYKQEDLDNAVQDYTKTLELDSQYAKPYVNRGVALSKQGKHTEAIGDYGTAIQLQPNYPIAYLNRGNSFLALGYVDYALEDYRDFIKYSGSRYPEQIVSIKDTISLLEKYDEGKRPNSASNIIPGDFEDTSTQLLIPINENQVPPQDEEDFEIPTPDDYGVDYLPDDETELLPELTIDLAKELDEDWQKLQVSDEGYISVNEPKDIVDADEVE